MYKLFFIFVALITLNPMAFGATARASRNVMIGSQIPEEISSEKNNDSGNYAAETARSVRNIRIKQPTSSSVVSARSATRTSVRSAVIKAPNISTTNSNDLKVNDRSANNSSFGQSGKVGVAARSAINTSGGKNKFADVMTDTAMPQDCVSAYNGCMDSLCILPNTSGGRCRCDDRVFKFDAILEQMQQFDRYRESVEQYGLERLQLGNKAEDVYSLADDTTKEATKDQAKNNKDLYKELSNGKKESEDVSLDMSGFSIGNLLDVGGLDIDGIPIGGRSGEMKDDITGKQGKELRNYANKLCIKKMPDKCTDYVPMLQALYTKDIGGDCTGYENALKTQFRDTENLKQKSQSNIRSAALTRYNIDNKYNRGQCVKAFKKCMTEEDQCGPGFKNCIYDPVVFAEGRTKPKKKTIKLAGQATIEIDEATYKKVEQQKAACEYVFDSCVKEKDNIWNDFLTEVVGELRSAELSAEADRLHNCSTEILQCITNAARDEGEEEGTENWDRFVSNPSIFEETCKKEIEHCAATNSVLAENIVEYVKYILDARRVDTCTKAVKSCYQESCGDGYALCVGKTHDDLLDMCTSETKGAVELIQIQCSGKENIRDYVSRVARGIFLEIDNALSNKCRHSVDNAMSKICGGTTYCDAEEAGLDYTAFWLTNITYMVCPDGKKTSPDCIADFDVMPDNVDSTLDWQVKINNNIDPTTIYFDYSNQNFKADNVDSTIKSMLQDDYARIQANIAEDETVVKCMNGNEVDIGNGFGGVEYDSDGRTRYPNLTESANRTIASSIIQEFISQYYTRLTDVYEDIASIFAKINGANSSDNEADYEQICKKFANTTLYSSVPKDFAGSLTSDYDGTTHRCTITNTYKAGHKGNEVQCSDEVDYCHTVHVDEIVECIVTTVLDMKSGKAISDKRECN